MSKLTRPAGIGNCRGRGIITLLALVCLAAMPGPVRAASIKVSWDPSRVKRGGVVLLRVDSPVPLSRALAFTGSENFPLLKTGERGYAGLVGVDVKWEEHTMPVDLSLFPEKGGSPYRIRADLKVRDETGTRKPQELSLPAGMGDLTQKRIRQVREDNRTLGDVLGSRREIRFWEEGFLLPLKGRITTMFGTGRVLNGKPRSPHSGVDIAGRKGAAVRASNGGLVILADDFYLSGKTVVLDHGWGIFTVYAHLDRIRVVEGQEVQREEVLGTVGSTGRATGPHLHWGAFIRGAKVDPLQLVEVTKEF